MPIAAVYPIAFALALVVFPPAIRAAWALGYLDHPEARKLHTSATALLGGAVTFVVALVTCLIFRVGQYPAPDGLNPIPLVGGAIIALSIGLWDDRWGMNPTVKFAGQGLAIGLMLESGALPDLHLGPVFNVAASMFASSR
jgi:UDP-GlcNAc:undecaprenyl-phosphate GlcNAc-1-phosphate transferase